MASIRDSVIDQYGNAVAGALVVLLNLDTSSQVGSTSTNANGFFEFNNLPDGQYRLQISGANLTTRIIGPIQAVDPYDVATTTEDGLMSKEDKAKLDNYGTTPALADLVDVDYSTPPTGGAFLTYNGSGFWYPILPGAMPFALLENFTQTGGTALYANKLPQLNGLGLIDYSMLDVTPIGGPGYSGQLPVLNLNGKLDPSLYDATQTGGTGVAAFKLVQLDVAGRIDTAMINTATVGGASSSQKIPKLNSSGRLDPSLLPTSGGTFRGSLDLTVPYVNPGWADGDYGASSTAGAVHSTWVSHLNAPVPTTMKIGDNIYFTGGNFSVVPTTTDLDAYLPRDGGRPMTGQLSLIDQTISPPTGTQAVSRAFADIAYQPSQIGAIPSVTQTVSKSTAVSLNAITGKIVTHNAALIGPTMAGSQPVHFVLSNNKIGIGSVVMVNVVSGGTPGAYRVWAGEIANGTCNIYLENIVAGSLAQPVTLQFHVSTGGL